MTRNPISIDKDTLASKSLSIMSEKKITSLCVHKNEKKNNYWLIASSCLTKSKFTVNEKKNCSSNIFIFNCYSNFFNNFF